MSDTSCGEQPPTDGNVFGPDEEVLTFSEDTLGEPDDPSFSVNEVEPDIVHTFDGDGKED